MKGTLSCGTMEEQLQELKDMIHHLQVENQKLQEKFMTDQDSLPSISSGVTRKGPQPVSAGEVPVMERLFYIPRERKCPVFRGTVGIGVMDWIEEVRSSVRAGHLSSLDQAYFVFDHLEGEAKEEIRYRPQADRADPERIFAILQELYGCSKSYVTLQEDFFSRRQEEGESLKEFSHALFCLMEKITANAPNAVVNGAMLLRDQFAEHVLDPTLRRELKKLIRENPECTLLDIRKEAIRWEQEGQPTERKRSSVPSYCALHRSQSSRPDSEVASGSSDLSEIKEMLLKQQDQIKLLSQNVLQLQSISRSSHRPYLNRTTPIICRRCQKPGHIARNCHQQRMNLVLQHPTLLQREAASDYQQVGKQPSCPDVTQHVFQAAVSIFPTHAPNDISTLQEADPTISVFLKSWRTQRRPDKAERARFSPKVLQLLRQWNKVVQLNGLLYRRTQRPDGGDDVHQLLLPESLKEEVMKQLHQSHGHQGVEWTTELIRKRCYWPLMHKEIRDWCQQCERCTLAKATHPQAVATKDQRLSTVAFQETRESLGPLRRTTRKTDGYHSNPHHLPERPRCKVKGATVSQITGADSSVADIFRPWC